MSVIPSGFGSSGIPPINNSLRFRSSASAYLGRTFGTPTNNLKWTWSGWVKRGALGADHRLFSTGTNGSGFDQAAILFIGASDKLQISQTQTGTAIGEAVVASDGVFRDPSAWYHVVGVYDSANATAEDRLILYVNGVRISQTMSTVPTISLASRLNAARVHDIGRWGGNAQYLDGYLARVCFVDGSALTPSSFGYTDAATGQWVSKSAGACKAVVDSGGTNSFMLDFDDGTSLTTLGNDYSAKNNDWTLNNISITAGVTYDWMTDTPTNNYAVLNPIGTPLTNAVLSEGNLKVTTGTSNYGCTPSALSVSSGKWYWECVWVSGAITPSFGISATRSIAAATWVGDSATSFGYASSGQKYTAATGSAYGASFVANDVIGFALDLDAGTLTAYKNNVSQGTLASGLSGSYQSEVSDLNTGASGVLVANFGQRPFAYTPPTGFKALCTANLPAPTIRNPSKHFDIKTRTGTAATYSVTGLEFQPDLVWVKSRGRAVDHALYDSVRGVQKQLESNQTGAETTETTGLTVFNSDGYTGGALDQINGTTATNSFVDWLWKAGGAAVTNTSGTITSQVSANTQAGVSVVTYTGTGANATVGHGLGVAPKMVIVKARVATTATPHWAVYHESVGNTSRVWLNLTNAAAASATYWNNTSPTSSTFSLGTVTDTNENTKTYVAYCFAEVPGFSKIGSYTGNGSLDGPFVWCGFKPKWILRKSSTLVAGSNWWVQDAGREPANTTDDLLYPNLTNAESVGANGAVDFLSNGFKVRADTTGGAVTNNSGETYIFIAFAEAPFNYATAR